MLSPDILLTKRSRGRKRWSVEEEKRRREKKKKKERKKYLIVIALIPY